MSSFQTKYYACGSKAILVGLVGSVLLISIAVQAESITVNQNEYGYRANSQGNFFLWKTPPPNAKAPNAKQAPNAQALDTPILSGRSSTVLKSDKSTTMSINVALADGKTSNLSVNVKPTAKQESYPFADYPCTYDVVLRESNSDFSFTALVDTCRGLLPRGAKVRGSSVLGQSLSSNDIDALKGIVNQLKALAGDFRLKPANPDISHVGYQSESGNYYGGSFYRMHLAQQICDATCGAALAAIEGCTFFPSPPLCLSAAALATACILCQSNLRTGLPIPYPETLLSDLGKT